MRINFLYTILIVGVFVSCNNDKIYLDQPLDLQLEFALSKAAANGDPSFFILPDSEDYQNIPQDPQNRITEAKVRLGNLLFFETGIANDPTHPDAKGTYSCASCHVPSAGFRPGAIQGVADGGIGFGQNGEGRDKMNIYEEWELDVQGVRPLSVLNVAFVENTTWNGRFGSQGVNVGTEDRWELDHALALNKEGFASLETQNMEGLEVHRMDITEEVLNDFGYRTYFDAAFGNWPESDRYSKKAAAFAISTYLRTLMTNKAPFQEYLKGDKYKMSEQEKRGALVFFGKAKCYHCHKDKNLGSNDFYALGVNDLYQAGRVFDTSAEDPRNLGRGEYSGKTEDMFKFKIPQLYNMGDAPFYFHGSSKRDLRSVVEYFNNGVPENPNVPQDQIARQFRPLHLTNKEMEDLTAFLETGLRDPDLERYAPTALPSGNCFPNNDPNSRNELGCN